MRRDGSRRIDARARRHRGDDNVGVCNRIRRGRREPRADFIPGLLQRRAALRWKQDIPGCDVLNAGLAQTRGYRLSGFAEPDETEARFVTAHFASLRWTR